MGGGLLRVAREAGVQRRFRKVSILSKPNTHRINAEVEAALGELTASAQLLASSERHAGEAASRQAGRERGRRPRVPVRLPMAGREDVCEWLDS